MSPFLKAPEFQMTHFRAVFPWAVTAGFARNGRAIRLVAQWFFAGALLWTATSAAPSIAQTIMTDPPTLLIRGMSGGSPRSVEYNRDELIKMESVSISTSTPWNHGVVDFEGVPLELLLKIAGVSGDTATVTALNDYSVDIPTSDFAKFGVILAIKRDGKYMPVDDQGPFFIIYPFDSDPILQGQPYHGRAVWQVREISVK